MMLYLKHKVQIKPTKMASKEELSMDVLLRGCRGCGTWEDCILNVKVCGTRETFVNNNSSRCFLLSWQTSF